MIMAGGGLKGGRVFGSTDEKGAEPTSEGYSPADLGATFLQLMGIDHHKEYHTPDGGPVLIVRDGQPIQGLLT